LGEALPGGYGFVSRRLPLSKYNAEGGEAIVVAIREASQNWTLTLLLATVDN
jgi:hypothetical protein